MRGNNQKQGSIMNPLRGALLGAGLLLSLGVAAEPDQLVG